MDFRGGRRTLLLSHRRNLLSARPLPQGERERAGRELFLVAESGFDAFNPAWPAQLVVFLASEAAGDFTGQGFVVWGGEVMLVAGWHILNQISKPSAAFTAADLIARKDELFGKHPRVPGYM